MIKAQGVSYRIGEQTILKDISIDVNPGQFLTVLGSNGAGKSTLLKVLSGELKGQVQLLNMNGKPLVKFSQKELALNRAVMSQETLVSFDFTVEDVVLMGRYAHCGLYETRIDREIANEAMHQADVYYLKNRIYNTLSGGEKQRVQLARVLTQIWDSNGEPKYLFLDEPTSSLDLENQYKILKVVRGFAERGVGILCILHDVNLAVRFSDKLVFLRKGELIGYGKPSEVICPEMIKNTYGVPVAVHKGYSAEVPFIFPLIV